MALFGPVFEIEAARCNRDTDRHHVWRTSYVCLLFIVLCMCFGPERTTIAGSARDAEHSFWLVVGFTFGAVALMTPALVAGSLAAERERRTIDLLLTTDLRPREIVFGRVLPRVLRIGMYLLAGLPLIAALQFFGGIPPELLAACYLCVAAALFGFAAVCLWISVHTRRVRDAVFVAYILLVVYHIGSLYLVAHFRNTSDLGPAVRWLAAGNAFYGYGNYTKALGGPSAGAVLLDAVRNFLVFHAVLAALLLGWVFLRFRALMLDSPGRKRARGLRRTIAISEERPMISKETRLASAGLPLWMRACVAAAAVATFQPFVAYSLDTSWTLQALRYYSSWMGCLIAALLFLSLAVRGANAYHAEVGRNTWESLVATPLRSWDILDGWFWGCIAGLKWVYAWFLLFCLAATFCGVLHPLACLLLVAAAAVYSPYFAWLGIRKSLESETPLRSSVSAVGHALLTNFAMLTLSCLVGLGFVPLAYAGMSWVGGALAVGALGSLNPMLAVWYLLSAHNLGRDGSQLGAYGLLALPSFGLGVYAWYWLAVRARVKCLEFFNERAYRDLAYPSHVFHMRTKDLRYNRGVGMEETKEDGPQT